MSRSGGRIDELDALRGFAIFGILLINIQVFSGYGFVGPEGRSGLPFNEHDTTLQNILDVFVRAKFYSLFSLLFGYSFVMLAQRAKDNVARLHFRRLTGLIVIGLMHSVLLWPWDILLLYGLTGLLLIPFLSRTPTAMAGWGIGLFAIVGILHWFGPVLGLPAERGELAIRLLQENVPALAGGSYVAVVQANLILTGSVFVEWLQDLRPLRVLGMFLLGAAAAVLQLADRDNRHKSLLRAAVLTGLLVGLVLALIEVFVEPETVLQRIAYTVADAVGAPLLAIGYAALLVLWWHRNGTLAAGVRAALAPVGRMALTNYLLHSAICVPFFYGFGAGYFAELSLTVLVLFAVALFVMQMVLSAVWLSVFRQGPIEWLWRWQISSSRPQLRKGSR